MDMTTTGDIGPIMNKVVMNPKKSKKKKYNMSVVKKAMDKMMAAKMG